MSEDIFEEIERENEEILRVIRASPVRELVGLVDACGFVGSSSDANQSVLTFTLCAWRDSSGIIHREEIWVEIPVTSEELLQQVGVISAYSIVGLRLQVGNCPNGRKRAVGSSLPVTGLQDNEFSRIAAELQAPVVVSDPILGDFILDRSINWFRGKPQWNNTQIRLDLSADSISGAKKCLKVAKALWKAQPAWTARVADYAVEHLLEKKNDIWLEDGEMPVTPESFKDRIRLESITVYPEDTFEFWFDDGDLFWGHLIQVRGDLSEGLTGVDTPG